MNIETLSCVVKGPQQVEVIAQPLVYTPNDEQTLVQIIRGGICGSDLHYYRHGKVGNFAIKHPMILGHEVIGKVVKTDAPHLHEGQKVAINPSKPCGQCQYCLSGATNQCESMRFFGSAMYDPHIDGGFTRFKVVDNAQCIPYPSDAPDGIMTFAEPLAVAIHAARRAGELQGKRVFISGVGPIGCLTVAAVKVLGAKEIVCTDVSRRCLQLAQQMGADKILLAQDDFSEYMRHKGVFDVAFEASGHPFSLMRCLDVTKARGSIVQIGMGGTVPDFPLMQLIAKEISWIGTFRFVKEFDTAVQWLSDGSINPRPLLSKTFPFTELRQALDCAGNKTEIAKVQLTFA